ncbi:MAG TPA: TerB family tellurite resistance protein [Robiginitalea sp.]|nr:TerB family tellurite resistance protein [Robiginitalea sp.]
MEFNLMEKLAVVKAVDEVIRIDDQVKKGEEKFMDRLSENLGFDSELLAEARRVEAAEALAVLRAMPEAHKQALARLLNEAANADGEVDELEIRFIYRVFTAVGIEVDI